MQGGRDPFFGFGDPFGSFGGFGGQRSLISNFFGGRDPFDDPFFTRPFGSMFESSIFGSAGSPFMNPRIGGPFMNPPTSGPFMNPPTTGFLEHHLPQSNQSKGPIIEELNSDNENEEKESEEEKKENPRKHGRPSKEPYVEDPDDEATEKKSKHTSVRNDTNQMHQTRYQPRTHSFSFQSSTVSYGGGNGAYYTSSRTRRTGSDGLTFEEAKEANSSTRQATHKGHSVTRKLNTDGHVDTMQMLHNLNEDELVGFEEAWKGNARKHLPGWSEEFASQDALGFGRVGQQRPNSERLALPSSERSNGPGTMKPGAGGLAGPPPRLSGRRKPNLSDGSRFKTNGAGSKSSCQ